MKKLLNYIEDILILLGLLMLIGTTFTISVIAGMYTTGAVLLILGIYFSIFPPKRKGGDND